MNEKHLFKPVTSAGLLADRLRDAINNGRWQPGDVLRQEDLAQAFGVSRIPIREALAMLQTEGLVSIEHYRGARVAGLAPAQVDEIFDLRMQLEGDLLARAAPLHDSQSVRALRRIQSRLDPEDEPLAWMAADRAFHTALYAPAQRPRTQDLVNQLRAPVERFSMERLSPGVRREAWSDEHNALIAAVEAGDAGTAVAVLMKHLSQTRLIVMDSLLLKRKPE